MGQSLEVPIQTIQKEQLFDKQNKKVNIPFSQRPLRASFNYMKPVRHEDQFLQSFNCLQQIITQEQEIQQEVKSSIRQIKVKWNSFIKSKQKDYLNDYTIVKNCIGRGGFGVVRMVKSNYTSQVRVAKVVRKKLMKDEDVSKLFQQLIIMRLLDHPNIIKLYEVYDFEEQFVLIIQMCAGGEVYAKTRGKKIPEKKAGSMMKQVLKTLMYMHNHNIVHRDIKPQNLLFENQDQKVVKLIDFGIAKQTKEKQFLQDRIGTPSYICPNIIYKNYDCKCDVWAVGVTLYQLISGKLPFQAENDLELFKEILRQQPKFNNAIWKSITPACIQAIKLMLTKKNQDRPTAKQIYQHEFFTQLQSVIVSSHDGASKNEALNNMKEFKFKNKLQAVVQTYMASQLLSTQEKTALIQIFNKFDVNHDGVISTSQLNQALVAKNNMSQAKVTQIMRCVDINDSGQIDYTEFLVANCDHNLQFTKERLKQVFQYFDSDHNGSITYSEVAQFLEDYQSSEEEIRKIFMAVDLNGDGSISEDQFIQLLLQKIQHFKPFVTLKQENNLLNTISQQEYSEQQKQNIFPCIVKNKKNQKPRKISLAGLNQLINQADKSEYQASRFAS